MFSLFSCQFFMINSGVTSQLTGQVIRFISGISQRLLARGCRYYP